MYYLEPYNPYIFPSFPLVSLLVRDRSTSSTSPKKGNFGLHVYYIHIGQYIHPIGSNRPRWAAGEL